MMISVLIAGRKVGVAVGRADLVLDEVMRLEHLADVVEIGPDAHEQGVGADPLGRGLGDRAHGDRVVVRARCAADQLLEQRVGDVAQLEQADARDDAEAQFSRNGRLPPRKNPAISPQPARQRLSLRIRSSGWSCQSPVAQVNRK